MKLFRSQTSLTKPLSMPYFAVRVAALNELGIGVISQEMFLGNLDLPQISSGIGWNKVSKSEKIS